MIDHLHPDELAALAVEPDTVDSTDSGHIDECARCALELGVLRKVSRRARDAQPDETPPPPPDDVWDRVVHELSASGDLPSTETEPVTPLPVWRQSWALAAAFVLVVVLGAAALLTLPNNADRGEIVAEADLQPLAEVEAGTAVLTADGESRALTIDTATLPEIDGYYELWLLASDGTEMVSLGPVDGATSFAIPEAVDVNEYSVVDISREPPDGNPLHSTDSVLRGPLQPLT